MTQGRTTLSAIATTPAPHANSSNPFTKWPLTIRITAAGNQTAAEPISGTNENIAVTNPHKSGDGTDRTQNARLISSPCANATASPPYMLAMIVRLTPLVNFST